MKKLLLIMMALVILAIPMVSAETLDGFNITIDTDPVMWNESVDLTIVALNETGGNFTTFNREVNVSWGEEGQGKSNLTSGTRTFTIQNAPKGNFEINVSYKNVSNVTQSFGDYYEITILDDSLDLEFEYGEPDDVTFTINNTGTLKLTQFEFAYSGDGHNGTVDLPDELDVGETYEASFELVPFGTSDWLPLADNYEAQVTITSNNNVSDTLDIDFSVVEAGPSISISPTSGKVGDTIDISGSNFGSDEELNILFDNVVVAEPTTYGDGSFDTTFDVPEKDAGDYDVTVVNYPNVSASFEITEEKLLYIDEVEINGEKIDLDDYENGDDIEVDAKKVFGEDLEVIVTVKNDDSTQDMDDVGLDVDIEDIDDDSDWEDDEDIGTIKEDEEEEVTFTSSIDWTPDQETFQVTVYVTGEGEDDGVDYEDEWVFDLKIEKEDDDLEITEAEFDYSSVEAGQTSYLTIEVTNIGSDDQDEAVVTVKCDELDFDFDEKDIEIDEGKNYDITIPIEIDDDIDPDDYDFEIIAYYDYDEYMDDDPTDIEQVTLSVVEEEEEEEQEESYPEQTQPEETVPDETGFTPQPIPTTTEISFRETTGYTLLLILGNVFLVVLIIFLLVKVLM